MFKRRPTRLSTQRMGRGLLFDSLLPLEDLEGSTHENNSTFGTPLQDLDLQSILSKIQLSFFSAEKPSVKLKSIEPSKSETNVQKCSAIPRGMFTEPSALN